MIEMMVVIGIVITLFGLGVAGYMSMAQSSSAEAKLASIEAAMSQARVFAMRTGSGSRVVIDTEERTFTPLGFKVIGLWHLEDESGAWERDLIIEEGEHVPGHIGKGILFEGRNGWGSCDDEALDRPKGVCIEAWVFPMLSGQKQYIFRKKKAYYLKITEAGTLEGGGKDVEVETERFQLPLHRWSKVSLIVDEEHVAIYVDEIERASKDEGVELPVKEPGEFQVSDSLEPFIGIIDEVRFMGLVRGDTVRLDEGEQILGGLSSVGFDGRGRLDSSLHGGEVEVGYSDGEKMRTFVIGRMGTVRKRSIAKVPPPPPSEGGEGGEQLSAEEEEARKLEEVRRIVGGSSQ